MSTLVKYANNQRLLDDENIRQSPLMNTNSTQNYLAQVTNTAYMVHKHR